MAEPAVPVDEAGPHGGDGPPAELDIQQELPFQDRSLRVQHAGWLVMALLALAGGLGLFGKGPLSEASASDGPVEVRWSRFARHGAPTEVTIEVDRAALRGGEVEVRLPAAWVAGLEVQQIQPEPVGSSAGPEQVVHRFAAGEGDGPLEITISATPDRLWGTGGAIEVVGAGTVELSQVVWP